MSNHKGFVKSIINNAAQFRADYDAHIDGLKILNADITAGIFGDNYYVFNPGPLPPGYRYGPIQVQFEAADDITKNLVKVTCYQEIIKT